MLAAVAGAWLVSHGVAAACTLASPPEPFVVDTRLQASDGEPPAGLQSVSASVVRSAQDVCEDGYCHGTSCEASGTVELTYEHAPGSAPEPLGVRIRLLEGALPAAMQPMVGQPYPLTPSLRFSIGFAETADLHAVIALTLIDSAGNESPESPPVTLTWSGCTLGPLPGNDCLNEMRFDCTDGTCSARSYASLCRVGFGHPPLEGGPAFAFVLVMTLLGFRRRATRC